MLRDLDEILAQLDSFPLTIEALVGGLPESLTQQNEGPNTWSVREIVAHLIHGEYTDWLPRIRMILEFQDSKTFEPFVRAPEQNESSSMVELLREFRKLREANLAQVRALQLTPSQLALPGRHPALGLVTMSQLIATWAAHDLTHLHQLSRVLAYPLRYEVGPWQRYLGVMHCNGHSE
jgi:hypothetical protein